MTFHRQPSPCTRLACLALVLAGCATAGSTGPRTTVTRFQAPGAGATHYDTSPPAGASLRGMLASKLQARIEGAGKARGLTLRPDPRLAELASWVAQHVASGHATPPNAAIDLVSHHLGMPEPAPHLIVLGGGDEATIGDRVAGDIEGMGAQHRYTHYGVASIDRDEGPLVVVTLSWRWLTLAPLPRAVDMGASVGLRASLDASLKAPQVVVTAPDGNVTRGPPGSGGEVAMTLPTGTRGEHRVEVLATGDRGVTVAANFPFYVGVPPVTHIELEDELSEGRLDAAGARSRLVELINQERAQAGVPPVALHPQLSEVARAHSQDMQDNGFVGHTSPTTGEAVDRVAAAGIRTGLTLENIGRGYSALGVHRGLMDSPGHRGNLLHPSATHVGIGMVVTHDDDEDRPTYLVTQLFIRMVEPLDLDDAPDDLLEAIQAARAKKGLPPLSEDGTLSELCQATAKRYFAEPNATKNTLVSDLNKKAAANGQAYSSLGAMLTVVEDLTAAAGIEQLLDPKATHVGIGVGQGTRPDGVPNAISVVLVLGYAR